MSKINLDQPSVFDPLIIVEPPQVQQLIDDLKQGKRNFKDSDLASLDLSGLDLSHTDLRNCNFFNCELRCVNFTGADLRGANFKGANLRTANLTEADLTEANLTDVDLGHVSLVGAILSEAKIVRGQCHRTVFKNTTLPDKSVCFRMKVTGNISTEDLIKQHQRSYKSWKNLGMLLFALANFLGFAVLELVYSWFF